MYLSNLSVSATDFCIIHEALLIKCLAGTAIYVYCIINPNPRDNITILLDGNDVGPYQYQTNAGEFQYNELIYSSSSLANGSHILTLHPSSGNAALLFDYAVYT